MVAAGTLDAALTAIRDQAAEIDARVRRRAAALTAEAAVTARLRDAEAARRRAERALDSHDEQQPRGLWARLTGKLRRWREERKRLDAAFDVAIQQERAAEQSAAVPRRAVAAVGRDGTRDAERWDALHRAEAAVRAGRRDVMEAAAGGDLDTAIRLSRPPPRPVPSRAERDGRKPEPGPTAPAPSPVPRPPRAK